ncbi:hypothetical protein HP439_15165 [Sphingobacterium shayense]|uniref:hypothetical protein n=1 Tax=Sphingobacterium shayense TaxID=626343 RepID=UPI001553CB71|nr:hypothetical protein [Sphingobacterium shayense]NQD72064.1 hypothetical protein [Sphingobacterium shayense]
MEKDKKNKILDLNIENEDKKMGETTGEDLKYNAQEDSFELDPETEDEEYQHPLPYDTSAPSGEDDNSSYDEENIYTRNEYQDKMTILDEQLEESETDRVLESYELEDRDEQLTNQEENKSPEEDEEGYPKRDDAGGRNNPLE